MSTRRLWLVHQWAGLIAGALLFLLCLTGVALVFRDEIDTALTPGRRVAVGSRKALLSEILQVAGPAAMGVVIPARADSAYTVYVGGREVFIDPYEARVTGTREGPGMLETIRQLHIRLYFFGWKGRVFVGFLGLTLLLSAITGALIYFPFMRGVFAQGFRWWQMREGLKPGVSDSHKLIGISSVLFMTVLGTTGALLGLEALTRYAPEMEKALHPRPEVKSRWKDLSRISADQAVDAARVALPGLRPTSLILPSKGSGHYTIYGNAGSSLIRNAASFVCVDAYSGQALQIYDAREANAGVRAYDAVEPLHFGDFGSLPLKLIYAAFGLAVCGLPVTGILLWYLK